jgi:hypothetical protein
MLRSSNFKTMYGSKAPKFRQNLPDIPSQGEDIPSFQKGGLVSVMDKKKEAKKVKKFQR